MPSETDRPATRRTKLPGLSVELEETIATYDAIAPDYARRFASIDQAEDRLRFQRSLPNSQLPILDAGCGPGRDCSQFEAAGLKVVGIDLSRHLIRIAHQLSGAALAVADVRRLPFSDMAFAGFWCSAVLLHLSPSDGLLALIEVTRVLVPGGALFLSVKRGQGTAWSTWREGRRRWFQLYETDELAAMVEKAGLIVESASVKPGMALPSSEWVHLHAFLP